MRLFWRKHDDTSSVPPLPDPEKEALNCYTASSCDNNTDCVMVQPLPMLVTIGCVLWIRLTVHWGWHIKVQWSLQKCLDKRQLIFTENFGSNWTRTFPQGSMTFSPEFEFHYQPSDAESAFSIYKGIYFSGKTAAECAVIDVGCGSRHTVCLTQGNNLWSFGWNKYGQLGLGDTKSRDSVAKMVVPPRARQKDIAILRCGDWGTAIVTRSSKKWFIVWTETGSAVFSLSPLSFLFPFHVACIPSLCFMSLPRTPSS